MKRYALLMLVLLLLSTVIACRGILEVGVEETPTPDYAATATMAALATENARLATQVATLITPTPTPNLGKVAYVQGGDIWVKALPNGEPERLTTDGRNSGPRWAPSGEWLAFQKSDYEVWVMGADGSAPRPLNEGAAVGAFAWAPVADRVAYVAGDNELQATNADGTDLATLVLQSPFGRIGKIAWSPDGEWVAYEWQEQEAGQPPTYQGLLKASADGKARIALYPSYPSGSSEIGVPLLVGWTGDDRFLLVQSDMGSASLLADGSPLYALPAEGGSLVQLADAVLAYRDFVVPGPTDTAQVAAIVGSYRGAWENKVLHLLSPSTGEGIVLTSPDVAASSPAWSPDGQRIAYVAMPDQGDLSGGELAHRGLMRRRLWVTNVEGGPQVQQLTDDQTYRDEWPLWSHDGKYILFARLDEGDRASLWLISTEGGQPQQVVDELTPAPEWFGYYGHIEWDGLFDWWRGPAVQQVQPEATAVVPVPTPTTTSSESGLLYLKEETVCLLGESGEQPIGSLLEDAGHLTLGPRYLAYIQGSKIQVLSLSEGTTHTLLEFPERPGQDFALRWSTDGSTLAYAVAWDEPDGSRMVELGTHDGYKQMVVDMLVARSAGPTPTLPLEPPLPPEPGFANLQILGFDRAAGRLAVTQAGGEERYSAIWFYDCQTGKRVDTMPVYVEVQGMALSPDFVWLAVATPGALHFWPQGTDAPPLGVELPLETHAGWLSWSPDSLRLAYLLNEGASPGLNVSPSLGLWVWEAESGQARQLSLAISPEAVLHGWTADGRAVVLEALDGISRQVTVSLVDVATEQVTPLPLPEGSRVLGWIGCVFGNG